MPRLIGFLHCGPILERSHPVRASRIARHDGVLCAGRRGAENHFVLVEDSILFACVLLISWQGLCQVNVFVKNIHDLFPKVALRAEPVLIIHPTKDNQIDANGICIGNENSRPRWLVQDTLIFGHQFH
jgi:hypothetical protein